jgi:putative DNA primase/helicase
MTDDGLDLDARLAAADTRATTRAAATPLPAATPVDHYGMPEPGPEIELPSPSQPMHVGRAIVRRARLAGTLPFRYWRGDFYQHTGTHWEAIEETIINKWLYLTTENAFYQRQNAKGEWVGVNWSPDKTKIGKLRHALSDGLLTHQGEEDRCIALLNGVYNLKTDRLDPHDEQRFNLTCLPFAYDPAATCPRWLQFLDEVLPGDPEAQDFLAEWFGYVLSGRTDQQKMLSMVGHKRSGKGTVARILEALLGPAGVTSPTINQLGGRFGEQSLIGKKLAVMSDVRWNNGHAVAEAVPVLLAISGEDARDVERKNRENWHGYLGVRFMTMSNDPPNFRDASGALAGRMLQVFFSQSFYGREDPGLTTALRRELPGIFNWAIAGLHRFAQRGRFVQPASGEALVAEVRRLASPYQAFLEDFCELDEDALTAVPDLLRAYSQWARREGRTQDQQTTSSLSRGLRTTDQRITADPKRRTLPNGQKVTMLRGVKLATAPTWLVADQAAEHDLYQQATLDDETDWPPADR